MIKKITALILSALTFFGCICLVNITSANALNLNNNIYNTCQIGNHVHKYRNGYCIYCGEPQYDYTNGIPEEFYSECPEAGTVETVKPKTVDGKVYNNPVQVYTPYGYDETKQYDVVFLVPGSNGSIYDWIQNKQSMIDPNGNKVGTLSGAQLFDWLIYTGQTKPFIAVSTSMNPDHGGAQNYDQAYSRYASDIVNTWLPNVVRNYGTYAASDSKEDIMDAKKHFHLVGLSQGSIFVAKTAIDPSTDLSKMFGTKALMSPYVLASNLEQNYNKDLNNTDKLYFVSGGKKDGSGSYNTPYTNVLSYKNNKTLGKFKSYTFNTGHKWATWFSGISSILRDLSNTTTVTKRISLNNQAIRIDGLK